MRHHDETEPAVDDAQFVDDPTTDPDDATPQETDPAVDDGDATEPDEPTDDAETGDR